ncbi:MAG: DUF2993 domain-containing protein [Candidatus Nanopelagicales bacterium]
MRRGAVVAVVAVLVLVVLAVVGDRAAVAVAQSKVSEQVSAELPGARDVTTTITGFPALTQVLRGSLDHVVVTARDVPTERGTLDSVVVDLYDVTTSAPRTAGTVEATAVVPLALLHEGLGDSWDLSVVGDALKAEFTGAVYASATVVPVVSDGRISLDLRSFSLLGLEVSGDSVPEFVTRALNDMVGTVGDLPFGLTPTAVTVTPQGVEVVARGTDVPLG